MKQKEVKVVLIQREINDSIFESRLFRNLQKIRCPYRNWNLPTERIEGKVGDLLLMSFALNNK